jgi:lysophospholipase L1-like esterase
MTATGHAIERPVQVIAQTGWTTDELAVEIARQMPLGEWDLVTLLVGVNNQYRGRAVADYRGEFDALLETAIGLAGRRPDRVQVLSIPDWGQTPFGAASGRDPGVTGREIDAFNTAARDVCDRHAVAFLDITGLTRARSHDPAMHAADGLHPSAAMYRLWAEALRCTGKFGRL